MKYTDPDQLQTGSIYSFTKKGSLFPIHGEVRSLENINGEYRITLYNLFSRKVDEYRFDKNGCLEPFKPNHEYDLQNSTISYTFKEKPSLSKRLGSVISRILTFAILLVMLITINPDLGHKFRSRNISYNQFLEKDLTLPRLYQIVTSRLSYRYDYSEEWLKPETAWKKQFGDCEEFAILFAAWCHKNEVEYHIVGLHHPNQISDHAVLFARDNATWYILDGTRASEPSGIRRLPVSSLEEATHIYSDHSANEYAIPVIDGKKEFIRVIW